MEIMESCVPPGFRFHPTEEELVGYYLKRKVTSQKIDLDVIVDVDLYRIEPWDIQDRCKLGYEEQNEWYFFSYKDRKYPTGTRTNRATAAGFWKATGRDKVVLSKDRVIGMRKTLVFYKGRAPNGRKSDWIMHEYRLQTTEHGPPQEEGWVVCRAFKKPIPNQLQQGFEGWNNCYQARSNQCRSSDTDTSYQLQSHPDLLTQGINHILHPSFPPPPPPGTFKSNHSPAFENPLVEVAKLDSPSLNSASFTWSSDDRFDHNHSGVVGNEDIEDEKRYNNEWKRLDLDGVLELVSSSSYAYTSMPLTDELDAQNHIHMGRVFDSFSD